jgi:SpoVK/Ycf46/Vps4 family AAA+-type ATPase
MGTFLQWMNDKTKPVFVVATSNNVSQLPPEFLRKGRFDELFFVDLPDQDEREEIFKIHIAKRNRKPDAFNVAALASATNGFTGAEIEAVITESLFSAFDEKMEVEDRHVLESISATVPLSRTMAAQIESLRTWANGRTRKASLPKPQASQHGQRKIA